MLFDVSTGNTISVRVTGTNDVSCSEDGTRIVTTGPNGTYVHDGVFDNRKIENHWYCCAISANGQTIVLGGDITNTDFTTGTAVFKEYEGTWRLVCSIEKRADLSLCGNLLISDDSVYTIDAKLVGFHDYLQIDSKLDLAVRDCGSHVSYFRFSTGETLMTVTVGRFDDAVFRHDRRPRRSI